MNKPKHVILVGLVGTLLGATPFPRPHETTAADRQEEAGLEGHRFELDAHDGRTTLGQLRGQPILIAGWRQKIPDGLHAAWFASEMSREYSRSGLRVILEDRDRWNETRWWRARSFWLRFFDTPVWFAAGEPGKTKALPFDLASTPRDEHSIVLVGVDGAMLVAGSIADVGKKEARDGVRRRIRTAIKQEFKRMKSGWGSSKDEIKVRAALYGKGRYGQASNVLEKSDLPPEVKAALRDEIDSRFDAEAVAIRYLAERGRAVESQTRLRALEKAARGNEAMERRFAGFMTEMADAATAQEKKLGTKLDRLLKPLTFKKWRDLDAHSLYRLRRFADDFADSAVGRRARRLDPLIRDLVRISSKSSVKDVEERVAKIAKKQGR